MFLKGQLITLRAIEPSDAELLFDWENDMLLWTVSNNQTPFSKFILEEFVNAAHQDIYTNKHLRLMITQNESKATIGVIDLFEFDPQHSRIGLGIFVHQNARNLGIAKESIELVKQYCFNTLHLKQIFVNVSSSNTNSLALFEKCNFEKSGLKKSWHKTGINTYEDVWFMQCINPIA